MIAAAPAAADPTADPAQRLRVMLAVAAREIAALRARLAALEQAGEAGPHRRVHLTPDAPTWLVAEVRRAYRRRYHPDMAADQHHRRRSEEVFKRAELVFEEIAQSRGADGRSRHNRRYAFHHHWSMEHADGPCQDAGLRQAG